MADTPEVPLPDMLAMTGVPVSLRQYMEAILDEQRRGLIVAEQEREKAAITLRIELQRAIAEGDKNLQHHIEAQHVQISAALISAEKLEQERVTTIMSMIDVNKEDQRRALTIAEQEREKAASALRSEFQRTVEDGDRNLREHIKLQKSQVDELSATLNRRFEQGAREALLQVEHLRRERELITSAQNEAILKAERANEIRFASVNEFREQLAQIIGGTMPREVAESRLNDLAQQLAQLTTRIDRGDGRSQGSKDQKDQAQPFQIWAMGAILTLVVLIINLGVAFL